MSDINENKDSYRSNPGLLNETVHSDSDVDVRGIFLMLWRRKMMVIGVMLIGLSLTTIAMSFVTPRYKARSLLLIEPNSQNQEIDGMQSLISTINYDGSLILNELEILRSRTLVRNVIERLDLMADPEFNPRFQHNLKTTAESGQSRQNFRSLSVYGSELKKLPPEVYDREIADVITVFLSGLSVRSIPGSFAIQVEFTSTDPNKAALITNAIVDVYIEQGLEDKFKATKKLTSWLDKRLTDLREQVRVAEAAAQEYKAMYNLTEGTRNVVSAEELSQLNSQLVLAKTKKAEAEARLNQIKDLVRGNNLMEDSSDIASSEMIDQLKLDEVKLEGRLSELLSRYKEKHPEIIKLKSELAELRKTIRGEMDKIKNIAEREVSFAEARVQALEEGLEEVTGQRNDDDEAMIKLRELQREAASTRLIFDTFLETYKRSDNQEELQEAEARVISYAIVPGFPSYPNKMLVMSLSAVLSLFIGLTLAILLEKMDNSYRSANQLEASLGYPCYALIPNVENMSQTELTEYIVSKPSSIVAEAVRTLRMVLNLRPPKSGKKPKVVTITSSFPGEGKTTLSVWLGRLAAKSGEKVIVIDADLRRPNIHRAVGQSNDVTLVEYLTGQNELDEVIQKDLSGAHMIYGRSIPNSALDLISSSKLAKLVESLRQVYDLVIIDSPACLAVSDSRVLANISDRTLYAVEWDKTPREVVMTGVKQFYDMHYEPLAFVLTNVDVKRHVRYGYGDTVYYYGRYKEYYSD